VVQCSIEVSQTLDALDTGELEEAKLNERLLALAKQILGSQESLVWATLSAQAEELRSSVEAIGAHVDNIKGEKGEAVDYLRFTARGLVVDLFGALADKGEPPYLQRSKVLKSAYIENADLQKRVQSMNDEIISLVREAKLKVGLHVYNLSSIWLSMSVG
jgi:hypothetical protein